MTRQDREASGEDWDVGLGGGGKDREVEGWAVGLARFGEPRGGPKRVVGTEWTGTRRVG